MNRGHIEQVESPDHSVKTGNNSPVLLNKFNFPKDQRTMLTLVLGLGACLALSIAVNAWCAYTIRDIGTRKWLHDYDLEQFKGHEFAELRNNVEVTKLLIAAQCQRPKPEK